MLALIIILSLLAAALIPLSVHAAYDGRRFSAYAGLWFHKISLYPAAKKPEKEKTEAETETEAQPPRGGGFIRLFSLNEWTELAKAAFRAMRRLGRGIAFDPFILRCVISGGDPYEAVMRYNAVNGFVGALLPIFESEFSVKRRDILVDLDTDGGKNSAEFEVGAYLRVGTLFAVGLAAGFAFLKILIKNRIHRIRERTSANGKQQTERNDAVNDEKHQEPC